MVQIATDGGFLEHPFALTSLLIAPAERVEVVMDFSNCAPGAKIILRNDAVTPYPGGDPVDPDTTGQILQFEVENSLRVFCPLPDTLNRIPRLTPNVPPRYLFINEIDAENGPTTVLLCNSHWMDPGTEFPIVGSTEDWVIANLTDDTHPIHLHLIFFHVISRQPFDAAAYAEVVKNHMPGDPIPSPEPYATGAPEPPDPSERGWKDTVRVIPGHITTIRVRFAPQRAPLSTRPGQNYFPFDPTEDPEYVWHCHMLAHEDNDMMRPMKLVEA